ncbi:molybdopterin biosynthesis protein MoeA [Peptoclostridium acidaminophilum DSM 3953]|uniref:Molybdopterin molybdenumtransferase n=1 Tax=Peptoclostridium acidaminophilum DSM 3953 TaxID=1286171 RepID=W8T1Y5_PEPAC|nr:gephyrin-like molybdotransferase Glp [Peptoclostridium acidaminophilum]AHM55744.1 molybdopterin biosynthesis protein MoeA [Peptoclostridium acidaminophilum DSM 3953]
MDFFNVVTVQEALERIYEKFEGYELGYEECQLSQALGRVLYEDIIAMEDVPGFDRSTVDGYAIKSSDSHGSSDFMPSFLELAGSVRMGESTDLSIKSGQAAYVPTGGMLPEGADCVAMIEYVQKVGESMLTLHRPAAPLENVIRKGDDIQNGQNVLKRGKTLRPQEIGVLAALGKPSVKLFKKPRIYIISTGDEVVDAKGPVLQGQIRDINGYALEALAVESGCIVSGRALVRDSLEELRAELDRALEISDIVLISGGSSVGERDYTEKAMNSYEGEGTFIHGIAIKPGKPTIVGKARGKAVFGLPGHPVSAMIVFNAIVKKLIKRMSESEAAENFITAIMDMNVHSSPGRTTYQMVRLHEADGEIFASPEFGKSGMISLLSRADGYVEIPDYCEGIEKGEHIKVSII